MQIVLTSDFKRDIAKKYLDLVSQEWLEVFTCLTTVQPLPPKYKDHKLTGNLDGWRDCHVKPDLVLIYRITDEGKTLELLRLNSHSEVFKSKKAKRK